MGLGKLVDLNRPIEFIGRPALERIQRDGPRRRRCGVFLEGPKITPNQHPIPIRFDGEVVGLLSEVTHSPRLRRNIGLALVSTSVPEAASGLNVYYDDAEWPVSLADLPFI